MSFVKAVKYNAKLRMAICGPSGSGKTYTSLNIAKHFGKVAVIDTETGSASKYADLFEFDTNELTKNYHPQRFIDSINAAAKAGYDILIIDSLSHAWAGEGGLLDEVNKITQRSYSKNSFNAWSQGTPIQNKLIDAILSAPLHIIATMRSKHEYVLEEQNKGGRKTTAPRKVGMAPVQRADIEYEFDVSATMDLDNNMVVDKTRCHAMARQVYPMPGADVADILKNWLIGEENPIETLIEEVKKEFPGAEVSPDEELETKANAAIKYFGKVSKGKVSQTTVEAFLFKSKQEWSSDDINNLRVQKELIQSDKNPERKVLEIFGVEVEGD